MPLVNPPQGGGSGGGGTPTPGDTGLGIYSAGIGHTVYQPGVWIQAVPTSSGYYSDTSTASGLYIYSPVIIARRKRITGWGVQVKTTAAVAYLTLYGSAPNPAMSGRITVGQKIATLGGFGASTAGGKVIADDRILEPGIYWVLLSSVGGSDAPSVAGYYPGESLVSGLSQNDGSASDPYYDSLRAGWGVHYQSKTDTGQMPSPTTGDLYSPNNLVLPHIMYREGAL